jgi:putative Mg2+ transporter-C (MgtC) family protein
MMPLSGSLQWTDVALRLLLAVVAGILLGYNRNAHGKATGMTTMVLVCVAACVAMIQVNVLLPTAGRTPDSFVMNDLMRLPLGILTGVGFIGAGAILHRHSLVMGVTTAATLWLGTVIGLCLGGGQIPLGLAAAVLGLFALWVLKWIESKLRQEKLTHIHIESDMSGPGEAEIRGRIEGARLTIVGSRISVDTVRHHRILVFDLLEIRHASNTRPPNFVDELAGEAGILKIQWKM